MVEITKFKPIYLICEQGVSPDHVLVAIEGINEVLALAGVVDCIQVHNFGIWRNEPWRSGDKLLPHCSVDWYIDVGKEQSTQQNQIWSRAIIHQMAQDPWQKEGQHYDVMVLRSDLYENGCNFIIGQAMEGVLALISVNRFLSLDNDLQRECIKSVIIHEIGHMFGLPRQNRTDGTITESLGNHCTNICIMRQGLAIPKDFIFLTQDRLRNGPFCENCLDELRQFFQ